MSAGGARAGAESRPQAAAWATVLARREKITPAAVDVTKLQRTLVTHGVMITFFNDVDMGCTARWLPALQILGTRGFFEDYDAWPHHPLDAVTAAKWAKRAGVPEDTIAGQVRGEAADRCLAAMSPS